MLSARSKRGHGRAKVAARGRHTFLRPGANHTSGGKTSRLTLVCCFLSFALASRAALPSSHPPSAAQRLVPTLSCHRTASLARAPFPTLARSAACFFAPRLKKAPLLAAPSLKTRHHGAPQVFQRTRSPARGRRSPVGECLEERIEEHACFLPPVSPWFLAPGPRGRLPLPPGRLSPLAMTRVDRHGHNWAWRKQGRRVGSAWRDPSVVFCTRGTRDSTSD